MSDTSIDFHFIFFSQIFQFINTLSSMHIIHTHFFFFIGTNENAMHLPNGISSIFRQICLHFGNFVCRRRTKIGKEKVFFYWHSTVNPASYSCHSFPWTCICKHYSRGHSIALSDAIYRKHFQQWMCAVFKSHDKSSFDRGFVMMEYRFIMHLDSTEKYAF